MISLPNCSPCRPPFLFVREDPKNFLFGLVPHVPIVVSLDYWKVLWIFALLLVLELGIFSARCLKQILIQDYLLLAFEMCCLLKEGLDFFVAVLAFSCKTAFSPGQVLQPLQVMEIVLRGGGH